MAAARDERIRRKEARPPETPIADSARLSSGQSEKQNDSLVRWPVHLLHYPERWSRCGPSSGWSCFDLATNALDTMPLSQQYIESDDDSSRDRSASPKTSSAAKSAKVSDDLFFAPMSTARTRWQRLARPQAPS